MLLSLCFQLVAMDQYSHNFCDYDVSSELNRNQTLMYDEPLTLSPAPLHDDETPSSLFDRNDIFDFPTLSYVDEPLTAIITPNAPSSLQTTPISCTKKFVIKIASDHVKSKSVCKAESHDQNTTSQNNINETLLHPVLLHLHKYKCEVCSYGTNICPNFKRHNKSKRHQKKIKNLRRISIAWYQRKHICNFCRYGTDTKSNLTHHINSQKHRTNAGLSFISWDQLEFTCEDCKFGTNNKSHFKFHEISQKHINKQEKYWINYSYPLK